MESQAEPFVYKESFSNILPPKSNEILKVIVWTIIDGQLIAKSSVNYLNDDETRLVFWTKKDYYPYHNVISPFLDVKTINFSGSLAHLPNLLGCYLKKRYLFVCFCLSNSYVCLWNLISRKIVFFFFKDTNLTTSSAPGSKNDDDISNDEVMNQASPIITPISDDKPFNIQCSTINESSENFLRL